MNLNEQTARYLFNAVKKASVDHADIGKGDRIVVTGADDDIDGVVNSVDTVGDVTTVVLDTSSGEETLQVSSRNFIHIIQRATDMLDMRKHIDYERDLKDADKGVHKFTEKDQRPTMGPDEKSDKSEFPTSKISLMMKSQKES